MHFKRFRYLVIRYQESNQGCPRPMYITTTQYHPGSFVLQLVSYSSSSLILCSTLWCSPETFACLWDFRHSWGSSDCTLGRTWAGTWKRKKKRNKCRITEKLQLHWKFLKTLSCLIMIDSLFTKNVFLGLCAYLQVVVIEPESCSCHDKYASHTTVPNQRRISFVEPSVRAISIKNIRLLGSGCGTI